MDLKDLSLLPLLIVDPNLSKAAERLGMTQSALSKRVQHLEAEIGFPLFERRGPKGLRALPQAIEFAQLSDRLSHTWRSGVRRIKRVAAEPEHFVLVGPPLFLREIFLPYWSQIANQFPDIRLEVQVSSLEKVSLETIQAGADAGILEHREELADYVCKPIYNERWGIVRNPKNGKKKDLKEYAWGTYSTQNNPVDTWLVKRQKMSPPNYHFYWQDLTAIRNWITETRNAASVLPWHVVQKSVQHGLLLFEPLGPDSMTKLYLAYARTNPHKALLKLLTEIPPET